MHFNYPLKARGIRVAHAHDHDICIDDAMERAVHVCEERGVRLTDLRKTVLGLIWNGHEAVKAYDLLDELAALGGSAKPPTVYRALEFLMEQGLVHKIESLNAYVGCPHPEGAHVSQFFICEDCGYVEEVHLTDLEKAIKAQAKKSGFEVKRQTVEIRGQCKDCHSNESK